MFIHRLATRLAPLAVVSAVALGAVSAASAAPAEVTSVRECYPDVYGTVQGTICYTIHAVEKSGANSKESGSMLIEFFDADGNLVFSDKTQWHTTIITRGDDWQVYHDQTKVRFTEGSETCTNGMNAIYANGETRHLGPEWEWVCK